MQLLFVIFSRLNLEMNRFGINFGQTQFPAFKTFLHLSQHKKFGKFLFDYVCPVYNTGAFNVMSIVQLFNLCLEL